MDPQEIQENEGGDGAAGFEGGESPYVPGKGQALEWLLGDEKSGNQDGPLVPWRAEGGNKGRPPRSEREEVPQESLHIIHEGRENAGKWSLAPLNQIKFLGASNLKGLPRTDAWDLEVHSFPGATMVDGYTILKHRTKATSH